MSLLEGISKRKSLLRPCDTIVTLPSGKVIRETRTLDGHVENQTVGLSSGFVVDMKPDLKVATVMPGLCIGSQDAVQAPGLLKGRGVTHILSVGIMPDGLAEDFQHLYVPLLDVPNAKLQPAVKQSLSFIDQALLSGGCVYVHCNAGVSRSASIVIAYLIRKGMSFDEAYKFLKSKREEVRPNEGFIQQLKEFTLERDNFNDN